MKNFKKGFTLAEVLVTLGIIGVVSAMTVPSLMNNYQRQTYVTQLHKVYNEISQALTQYKTDRNALNLTEAGLTSTDAIDAFVKKYFKIVNDCGTTQTPCFASECQKMSGKPIGYLSASGTKSVTLANGAAIEFKYFPSGNVLLAIAVDVNGAKGPNIAGRDMFAMYVYNNGLIDDYYDDTVTAPLTSDQRENSYTTYCNGTSANWYGCFGKILNDNWQMTY